MVALKDITERKWMEEELRRRGASGGAGCRVHGQLQESEKRSARSRRTIRISFSGLTGTCAGSM